MREIYPLAPRKNGSTAYCLNKFSQEDIKAEIYNETQSLNKQK